ncbi:right-handed parallel beta-helix repeat-containing protein [Cellulophaga sp. Z1A5H]|uniref:right-handed parallel beta-helix repeat-containing protein n=1 Tax=Cellulophaga sp. Z1A5H TaxID=2687291 RepID=UPI0013FE176B|nr:right-handed parallel beta-helix repeat-containing protein [Cellulophaga sp. Z1A5H]
MKRIFLVPFIAALLIGNSSSCKKETDFMTEVIIADEVEDKFVIIDDNKVSEEITSSVSKKEQGSSYCGPYTISEPLILTGLRDTIISGLEISDIGYTGIKINDSKNVIIENCYFHDIIGNGIEIYSSSNITIQNNRMEYISTGVYAQISEGIKVLYNDVRNVTGPMPRGQLAQLNGCFGESNKINYNILENENGKSNPEDAINIYKSSGTASSPIEIIGNWIRGGGPSLTGGGIMTGDQGGSYILVKDNILVNPGQYGIAIACGQYIEISGNLVYSEQLTHSNVGIYAWNQATLKGNCNNNTIKDNSVHWKNLDGSLNSSWNNGDCGVIEGWTSNNWNSDIDVSILPEIILSDDCNN